MRAIFTLMLTFVIMGAMAQKRSHVPLADPFIYYENGVYYAYGTHSLEGFEVYTSKNLKEWNYSGLALTLDDSYSNNRFFAPEVYKVADSRYLMYYSANEHVCVAEGTSPLGPFRQKDMKPIFEDFRAIDNHLFIDDDGTPYMFFVNFDHGNVVSMVEMERDFVTPKRETMRECCRVSQDWERQKATWDKRKEVNINEGPFVIKHNGTYFLTYSANSFRSEFYSVGYATTKDIRNGKWEKYTGNPILANPGDLLGTGHHAFFCDKEDNLRVVFHAHHDKDHVRPRMMYIGKAWFETVDGEDVLQVGTDYLIPKLNNSY